MRRKSKFGVFEGNTNYPGLIAPVTFTLWH